MGLNRANNAKLSAIGFQLSALKPFWPKAESRSNLEKLKNRGRKTSPFHRPDRECNITEDRHLPPRRLMTAAS